MQPRVKGSVKTTSRVDAADLASASNYVLTHQDTDPKTGALRTSLVKVLQSGILWNVV